MESRQEAPQSSGLLSSGPFTGVADGSGPHPAGVEEAEAGWSGRPTQRCGHCGYAGGFRDLLPLIGLPRRWNRCASCSGRVRKWVPLVELALGATLGAIAYQHGIGISSVVLACYCAVLVYLALFDLEHSLLPNVIVLPAIPLAVALFPFSPLAAEWSIGGAYLMSLAGAGVGFGIMLLVYLFSLGRLGAGDVKLAALLGAVLGFPQIVAGLALGFVLGGAVGVTLLALGLKRRTDAIPFGPALVGSVIAILLGGAGVYAWYLRFLG